MIKKISQILNPRLINSTKIAYFKGDDEISQTEIKQLAEQFEEGPIQTIKQQQIEDNVEDDKFVMKNKRRHDDQFEDLQLFDSNWKFLAPFVHIQHTFTDKKKDQNYYNAVNQKLAEFQRFINFDLKDLDRLHVNEMSQFEIKRSILKTTDVYRYLETDTQNELPLESPFIVRTKLMEMIQQKNITGIRIMFKNGEISNKNGLAYDDMHRIANIVLESNINISFLLNLLDFNPYIQKTHKHQKSSPKKLQQLFRRSDMLEDVNKLKTFWAVYKLFLQKNNKQTHLVSYGISAIIAELPKIGFKGLDGLQTQRQIRMLFDLKIGKKILHALTKYSIQKFDNYEDFVNFWGSTILLFSKLHSFNGATFKNIELLSLNKEFNLFKVNLEQYYDDILFDLIPEQLHKQNHKLTLMIYRDSLRNWRENKVPQQKRVEQQQCLLTNYINQKFQAKNPIEIVYTGWRSEFPHKIQNRLYSQPQKQKKIFDSKVVSEQQMIKNLIHGDYSKVLNYFLLTFNPAFDRLTYASIKKIIAQAKQMQFQDQNAKSYYLLLKISDLLRYQAKPVALKAEYFKKFKQVKWLQYYNNNKNESDQNKRQKSDKLFSFFNKPQKREVDIEDDFKSYSRKKEANPLQSHDPVSKERIYRKQKIQETKSLFTKKQRYFSTSTETPTDSYAQYRQVVKDLSTPQTSTLEFAFEKYRDLKSIQQYAQQKSAEINQSNYASLINQKNIPIVGSGSNVLKYLFLNGKEGQATKNSIEFDKIKAKLKVSFVSQIGGLQKDYSQYLQDCRFMFQLSDKVYTELLQDQVANYSRKAFKTIFSHMVAFKTSMTEQQITHICDVCKKNKIGITLIQMYYLMINNKIKVSNQGIYKICDTVQKFRKINSDVFILTKKYCENLKIPFQIKMMSGYCKSLLLQDDQAKLLELSQILKDQLKMKPYKVKPEFTAQENIKLQKQYKEIAKKEYAKIVFQIIHMIVSNVDRKLPKFLSELFDEYEKLKLNLEPNQIAISLMVYSGNLQKFVQILESLRQNPKSIVIETFDWALKAMMLNPRSFQQYVQNVFNVILFTHKFQLTEEQVAKTGQLFRLLNNTTVFTKMLQFMMRYNTPINHDIKNAFYSIMNNSNDDFTKNNVNGMLDFIFNPNREKEREIYRNQKIAEEEKAKLIKQIELNSQSKSKQALNNDQNLSGQTNKKKQGKKEKGKQDKITVIKGQQALQAQASLQQKEDKPGKKVQHKSKKQLAKQNKVKPEKKGSRVQRSNLLSKKKQGIVMSIGDQVQKQQQFVLKKNIVPKKLSSKSMDNFSDLFAYRDQTSEQVSKGTNQKGTPTKGAVAKSGKDSIKKDDPKGTKTHNPQKTGAKK